MGASLSKQVLEKSRDVKHVSAESWSVYAWGRNRSGQCGVDLEELILKPRQVPNLPAEPVTSLFAGHAQSSLITAQDRALVWGGNASGELGLGRPSSIAMSWVHTPSTIPAFDGQHSIRTLALGNDHSLFVDASGGLWSAGSNKEGQLGLGTPLQQQYGEDESARERSMPIVVMMRQMDHRLQRMGFSPEATGEAVEPYLVGLPPAMQKQRELDFAEQHHAVLPLTAQANTIAAAAAGLRHVSELMDWNGLGNRQMHSPARIGRALHDVLQLPADFSPARLAVSFRDAQLEELLRDKLHTVSQTPHDLMQMLASPASQSQDWDAAHSDAAHAGRPSSTEDEAGQQGQPLHSQFVMKVAAGNHFSLAVTLTGEVWTFGCGSERQLATGNYIQTEARRVRGRIADMIATNGGAIDAAVGESFCLALTSNGSVIVWGRIAPDGLVCNLARGLPGMVQIAAGRQHALLSDGESVWQCTLGSSPQQPGFDKPRRLPFKGSQNGVAKLSAGGDASAVVDLDGKLWMWGRLAEAPRRTRAPPKTAPGQAPLPCLHKSEKQPARIMDVDSVRHVAVGSNHVLVSVCR